MCREQSAERNSIPCLHYSEVVPHAHYHREHKACKSEGLLKAASHLILKNHLPQKQKTSFFNRSLVFVNSNRLRIAQL